MRCSQSRQTRSLNWTVHFEADAKDGSHIVIDGKLDNIGSYNRTITGTWTEGTRERRLQVHPGLAPAPLTVAAQ